MTPNKPPTGGFFIGQKMASRSTSLPAPVGGWNARDSLADMASTDAVVMKNWFPATTECVMRHGYSKWATGLPGAVESIIDYEGGSTSKLFAASQGKIYDITSGGAVGAAVVSGLSNARMNYCNISTAGGNFIMCANLADNPKLYNGTSWSDASITGVTATKLGSPIVFKNRVFFTESGTLKTWYLPVQSIGGAANPVDMSAVAQLGGYIVAHGTWTIDAGTGVDDFYVAVTSKGEIIVYQGTDPTSANTWALKGVWRLGTPVGNRCLTKFGGDLLYISQDGLVPLASALQSSRINPRVALTDKIQFAISTAVSNYGAQFGWQVIYFARENQLWLNVPVSAGLQEQYAMNTITKNWGQYQGWAAYCWEIYKDQPYFGSDGYVGKAWDTYADNGTNITATCLQSFSAYGAPGVLKRYTMIRPILRTTGSPALLGSINTDFDVTESTSTLAFSPSNTAVWDSGIWDTSTWASDLTIVQNWQGVNGVGYYAAPQIRAASKTIDVRWVSTDIVFERGGVL